MDKEKRVVHPYIPNSEPAVKKEMLQAVDANSIDEFYADVPVSLRLGRSLNLPEALLSEFDLVRHVEGLLAKNQTTRENL